MTTIIWTLLIILDIFIYTNIGYLLAHWSLKYFSQLLCEDDYRISWSWYAHSKWVWVSAEGLTFIGWLLFPVFLTKVFFSVRCDEMRGYLPLSPNHFNWVPPIYFLEHENYKRIILFVWPLKIAANAIPVIPGLLVYAIYRVIRAVISHFPAVITFPSRKLFKINHF